MTPDDWLVIAAYVHAANELRESFPGASAELDFDRIQQLSQRFRETGEAVSPATWVRFGMHVGEQLKP